MKSSECFDEGKDCECVRILSEGGGGVKKLHGSCFFSPFHALFCFLWSKQMDWFCCRVYIEGLTSWLHYVWKDLKCNHQLPIIATSFMSCILWCQISWLVMFLSTRLFVSQLWILLLREIYLDKHDFYMYDFLFRIENLISYIYIYIYIYIF